MRIKIDFIKAVEKTGEYGPYINYQIKSGSDWYYSIKKEWNQHWKAGDEIEAEVENKGKWKVLKPASSSSNTSSTSTSQVSYETSLDLQKVVQLLTEIRDLLQHKGDIL